MKTKTILAAALLLCSASAWAQEKTPGFNNKIPPEIMTPDTVETRIGTLKFVDGFPTKVSVIECFETDGGVNYRSDRLILF
jgi:hypothetical protein